LFGPPGAGKGTQGSLLADAYGVPHIATGDIIRDHIARRTEFGLKVEAAIAGGNFAPDEDILYWVGKRLAEDDAAGGYVLDGFPRDLAQAEAFDAHLTAIGETIDAAVELIIDEVVVAARLAGRLVCPVCGESYHVVTRPPKVEGRCDNDGSVLVRRPDDEPDAIKTRFEIYHRVTLPLREYYRKTGRYAEVDASGSSDEVFQRIRVLLEARVRRPE
jgi:adenylate kinase